ncbi:hypothetical protein EVAR_48880_1 [Eumeta japonica]|uniref:Uncharacterized protein n=1 Tax=Eumeta variegata TaxID=151549 RepID=A0A4C1Y905_EUMVA|nr:hypothetical protein EVAR_48880_1 [Eumeta japonica]
MSHLTPKDESDNWFLMATQETFSASGYLFCEQCRHPVGFNLLMLRVILDTPVYLRISPISKVLYLASLYNTITNKTLFENVCLWVLKFIGSIPKAAQLS